MYINCISLESSAPMWNSIICQFDIVLRKLPSVLPNPCDITPVLKIITAILKVSGISTARVGQTLWFKQCNVSGYCVSIKVVCLTIVRWHDEEVYFRHNEQTRKGAEWSRSLKSDGKPNTTGVSHTQIPISSVKRLPKTNPLPGISPAILLLFSGLSSPIKPDSQDIAQKLLKVGIYKHPKLTKRKCRYFHFNDMFICKSIICTIIK